MNNLRQNHSLKIRVRRMFAYVCRKYQISGKFKKTDFERVCEGENIEIVDGLLLTGKGYFIHSKRGNRYIYLSSRLLNQRSVYLEVAAHEIGHHFFRHLEKFGSAELMTSEELKTAQREANYFALLAMKKRGVKR